MRTLVNPRYRVRVVLEFEDRPSPVDGGDGSARWVELDPTGDPALAGAEVLSAVLGEEAAFRLAGHLSEAIVRGLELETGSLAGLAGRVDVDGSRFGIPPAAPAVDVRPIADRGLGCESGLSSGCSGSAVRLVEAPGSGAGGLLYVCEACASAVESVALPPAATRCQSPLEAYCSNAGVFRVRLLEPVTGDGVLVVCSPCGERLWAEGVAGEPFGEPAGV